MTDEDFPIHWLVPGKLRVARCHAVLRPHDRRSFEPGPVTCGGCKVADPWWETDSTVCPAVTKIVPFGVDKPLPCLLRAPHVGYRHYAVHPDDPGRFWTWDDDD